MYIYTKVADYMCHPRAMVDREVLWRAAFGFAFIAITMLYVFGCK